MKKKLFALALLTTSVSAFAAPISTPNNVSDTPIIGGNNGSCGTVDLTNATSDYNLKPCETAIIKFNNTTRVPLHIATAQGLYSMDIVSSYYDANLGHTYLLPNNTSYSGQFYSVFTFSSYTRTLSWYYTFTERYGSLNNYHIYGGNLVKLTISTLTTNKVIYTRGYHRGSDQYPYVAINGASIWRNTTTPWTSLGTINFSQATSGFILVKREY
jgi:hypothetical protein